MKQTITVQSRIDSFDIDVFIPDNWDENKMMIFHHGFNSGKNSETYATIGSKMLEKGIAYAFFSLPYHAERREDHKDFTVANSIEDCELVEKTIREKFPNTKIGILGTSFGGYLTLLRLHKSHKDYFAIILKSPAIKMDEILKRMLGPELFEYFKNQGYGVDNNKEIPMRINYSFYEELANNKVMDNPKYDEIIRIYHGNVDDTAPYEDSVELSNLNENMTLTTYDGENHRFSSKILNEFSEDVANYCKGA